MKCTAVFFLSFLPLYSAAQISIESYRMYPLYVGPTNLPNIPANLLSIAVDGCPCRNVIVKVSEGKIEKDDECGTYKYQVDSPGRILFTVYCKKANRIVKQGSRSLKAEYRMLQVTPSIMGKHKGTIKSDLVHKAEGVFLDNDADLVNFKPIMEHYRFTYINALNETITEHCEKTFFSSAILDILPIIQPGDRIIVDQIRYRWSDDNPPYVLDGNPIVLDVN